MSVNYAWRYEIASGPGVYIGPEKIRADFEAYILRRFGARLIWCELLGVLGHDAVAKNR